MNIFFFFTILIQQSKSTLQRIVINEFNVNTPQVLGNILASANPIVELRYYRKEQTFNSDFEDWLDEKIIPYLGNLESLACSLSIVYRKYFQRFKEESKKLKKLGGPNLQSIEFEDFTEYAENLQDLDQLYIKNLADHRINSKS